MNLLRNLQKNCPDLFFQILICEFGPARPSNQTKFKTDVIYSLTGVPLQSFGDFAVAFNLQKLILMYGHKLTFGEYALDLAAQKGNLALVKWLHFNTNSGTTLAPDYANDNGHTKVVEFLDQFECYKFS